MANTGGGEVKEEYVGKHRSDARTPKDQPYPKFQGGAKAGRKGKGAGGQQADGKNPQAGKWTFSQTGSADKIYPSSTTGMAYKGKKKKK